MRARLSNICTILTLACRSDGLSVQEAAKVASGPDLILITVESWRADHLEGQGYGRDTMPHLEDRLSKARVYTLALAPSSWTLPSIASIYTGLLPTEHGLRLPGLALGPDAVTTAEVLGRAGYESVFFGVNPWLVGGAGLEQGFRRWDARQGDSGDKLLRDLEGWLNSRTKAAPLFLHLHFFEPHCQYRAPRQHSGVFDSSKASPSDGVVLSPDQYESMGDCYRLLNEQGGPEYDLDTYLTRYDEELRATDDLIERSIELLDGSLGLSDSLVILAGDHGETFWEHDDFGHGRQLYQESVRVPLILLGGLAGQPGSSAIPVSLIDIHPTFLAAAGLELDPLRDLRQAPAGGPVFGETDQDGVSLRVAWIEDRKVLWDRAQDTWKGFELSSDPLEREPQFADLLLKRVLRTRYEGEPGPGLSIEHAQGSEIQEALMDLGYHD